VLAEDLQGGGQHVLSGDLGFFFRPSHDCLTYILACMFMFVKRERRQSIQLQGSKLSNLDNYDGLYLEISKFLRYLLVYLNILVNEISKEKAMGDVKDACSTGQM
jgi:hypothetical protein